jgi:hypothetical protein
MVLAQGTGVDWGLSMYHYISKYNNGFGLTAPEGVTKDVRLELYPDVLLKRVELTTTTKDPMVFRALELTVELFNFKLTNETYPNEFILTPKKIRTTLEARGYDWNILLNESKYGWNFMEVNEKSLSILDILQMCRGRYVPYWYPHKDKIKNDIKI